MTGNSNDLISKINYAIESHKSWKKRLDDAISSRSSDFSIAQASCDNACDFGKWIYGGDHGAEVAVSEAYTEICRAHTEFHRRAGVVLSGATGAVYYTRDQIESDISDYISASESLVALLNAWKQSLIPGIKT